METLNPVQLITCHCNVCASCWERVPSCCICWHDVSGSWQHRRWGSAQVRYVSAALAAIEFKIW